MHATDVPSGDVAGAADIPPVEPTIFSREHHPKVLGACILDPEPALALFINNFVKKHTVGTTDGKLRTLALITLKDNLNRIGLGFSLLNPSFSMGKANYDEILRNAVAWLISAI